MQQEVMYSWNVTNDPRTKFIESTPRSYKNLGSWLFPTPQEVGNQVLTAYVTQSLNYSGFNYPDYPSWISAQNAIVPDYETFIGQLVQSNSASTSVGQAQNRMVDLATQSQGQATLPQITKAAGGTGDTINWKVAIPDVSLQTAEDVAVYATKVAQDVGTGVMSTLSLAKYLPWFLGAAAIVYFLPQITKAAKSLRVQ